MQYFYLNGMIGISYAFKKENKNKMIQEIMEWKKNILLISFGF